MESSATRPPLVTISTKTEQTDNIGKGQDPIQKNLHPQFFPQSNSPERIPDYRKLLAKLFGEELIAEATKQDMSLKPVIMMIRDRDWESLKKTSKYFRSLRKDLAVTKSGCMLYDNKTVTPRNFKQLVIDANHQSHPGQTGLSLGYLVWFPCIHRSLTSKARACEECTKQGKTKNQ